MPQFRQPRYASRGLATTSLLHTPGLSLGAVFLASARKHCDRLALEVDDRALTYAALLSRAARLAAVMAGVTRTAPLLGAVFAARSVAAYEGVLGTLLSGAGYVPLNPNLPDARNRHMLGTSGSTTLVVDSECAGRLDETLAGIGRPLCVLMPEHDDVEPMAARHPMHRFVGSREIDAMPPLEREPSVDVDAIAYLLFTSGSTGIPKGVMVSHRNVLSHLEVMWERYAITEHDRFSQMFELTFDLSVFDLFVSWGRGASLHCVPKSMLVFPDEFIVAKQLTCWFSVPSVAMGLRRYRRLTPGSLASLRLSLFCGERLPAEVAASWQAAAPSSRVENLYGPTEVTIACTHYAWNDGSSPAEVVDGVVPIGRPFAGMSAAIVDDQLRLVAEGEKGELCMRGPQVSPGYWQDEATTCQRYVAMPWHSGPDNRWYRTGDLALVNSRGELVHCGRTDDQVKLRGHRIQLSEVEHALRVASASDLVAVLPFPSDEIGPTALTAVVSGVNTTDRALLAELHRALPSYMVPREIVFLDELPLSVNGKIDKRRLLEILAAMKRSVP